MYSPSLPSIPCSTGDSDSEKGCDLVSYSETRGRQESSNTLNLDDRGERTDAGLKEWLKNRTVGSLKAMGKTEHTPQDLEPVALI